MNAEFYLALKLPFRDGRKLAIGIGMEIAAILTLGIVGILVKGFGYSTAEEMLQGKMQVPEWRDFKGLFGRGLIIIIVSFIYFLPALVFLGYGIGFVFNELFRGLLNNVSTWEMIGMVSASGGFAFIGIGIALAVAAAFVLPMALVAMIKGSFKSAFEFGVIAGKIFTPMYILSWAFMILDFVILLVVASIIAVIPVAGTIVGAALMGYCLTVSGFVIFTKAYLETGDTPLQAAAQENYWKNSGV